MLDPWRTRWTSKQQHVLVVNLMEILSVNDDNSLLANSAPSIVVHGTCYPLGPRTWSRLAPESRSTTSSPVASTCTRSDLKPRSKIRAQVGLQSIMSPPSPIQHHRNFQIEVFTFKALFPYYEQTRSVYRPSELFNNQGTTSIYVCIHTRHAICLNRAQTPG